jgi:hypothetical protein
MDLFKRDTYPCYFIPIPTEFRSRSFIDPSQKAAKNVKFDGKDYPNVGPKLRQGRAELAGGEVVQGAEVGGEFAGVQVALAVKLAEKMLCKCYFQEILCTLGVPDAFWKEGACDTAGYSQRNTLAESAVQTTKTAASAATSPTCADHGSPFQIPWSRGTA